MRDAFLGNHRRSAKLGFDAIQDCVAVHRINASVELGFELHFVSARLDLKISDYGCPRCFSAPPKDPFE